MMENYNSLAKPMIYKIIDFLVRFAALFCFIFLVGGYSWGNTNQVMMELVMIGIWLQMDYKNILSALAKIKDKIQRP
ncbi:hypothetical protein ABHD31_03710 [Enterobacter cloacae]|nr:hypothetical protein [Enterobacter cloacae]